MSTLFISMVTAIIIVLTGCGEASDMETNPVENLPNTSGYPIVGTYQTTFFNNSTSISSTASGEDFHGQNANYPGNVPHYVDNGDGTVTDIVTGLMWQNSFDHNGDGSIDYDDKLTYDEILDLPGTVTTAGYDDWRVPTIKEQYSLIMFNGRDIAPDATSTSDLIPFINTEYFEFAYGDLDAGERLIDMQCATTNKYVSTEVERTVFGVNFADGRIKGYGIQMRGGAKAFNYLLVRGNPSYGINDFVDNGDGTISDFATGLMWMQKDNEEGILWEDALSSAENMEFAGFSDWRLPDAKELQSIVDYSRSPQTSQSPAIDPLFQCTQITNEAGEPDYPWYWSNTTHARMSGNVGASAAYISFGRCMGNMPAPSAPGEPATNDGTTNWIDVHGAGAQRSDPKTGDPAKFSEGHGPQGDAIRIYNYVRLVRNL